MYKDLFRSFLESSDSLRVYENGRLIFNSPKSGLLPLMEYIAMYTGIPEKNEVTIFDKIAGNASALLAVRARCKEILSPKGSELAIKTLNKYSIVYQFDRVVPYITMADEKTICPMEKLSMEKEPDEFYIIINHLMTGK